MLTIEEAKEMDAESITKIKIAAYNGEINRYLRRNGGPTGYDSVESELAILRDFKAYKILLDGQLIGAFFLIPQGKGKMRFEDFVIEPAWQGKGYGQETLRLIEKTFPHIHEWRLSTPVFSIGNQHLYEKSGFHEVARNIEEIEYQKLL